MSAGTSDGTHPVPTRCFLFNQFNLWPTSCPAVSTDDPEEISPYCETVFHTRRSPLVFEVRRMTAPLSSLLRPQRSDLYLCGFDVSMFHPAG